MSPERSPQLVSENGQGDRTAFSSVDYLIAHVEHALASLSVLCAKRGLSSEVEASLRINLEEELRFLHETDPALVDFDEGQRLGDKHFEATDLRVSVVLGEADPDVLTNYSE